MKLEQNLGVQGYFKLVARDENGNTRELTDWFPNLVLNSGLNRMSKGTWVDRCLVGSGSSNPVVTQTSLDNFVASTTSMKGFQSTRQLTESPYYYSCKTTFSFGQGAAAGNLSEIALGWSNTECWNRSLIKDSSGSPTTITVLQNEFLDVLTEIRIYPGMETKTKTVRLLDGSGGTISSHTVTSLWDMSLDVLHISPYPVFRRVRLGLSVSDDNTIKVYSSGNLNDIKSSVSGTRLGDINGVANTYPTSTSARMNAKATINQLNGVHSIVTCENTIGNCKWQIDPPITKDSAQELTHSLTVSWSRRT